MPSRPDFSWRSLPRRLAAAATLLAYIATTVGVPLPGPTVLKDGGKAFPCQGRPCGCQTAEDCWRHCCCFTPEERWAWAEAHGVQPPEYAEKPAADGWRAAPLCEQGGQKSATADACPCCRKEGACAACQSAAVEPPARASRAPLPPPPCGPTASPMRCHGLNTQWATTGVVPAAAPARPRRPEPAVVERLTQDDLAPRRVFEAPPLPPPRLPFSA